jgi:membrane protease YdiL (CAAX protease family)
MNAPDTWAGLADSAFLSGSAERERDPARILCAIAGGAVLGLAAAMAGLLLVMIPYTLLIGEGTRGLTGLGDALRTLTDPRVAGLGVTTARLAVAAASDGMFLLVFVTVAAVMAVRPLHDYVTVAPRVRWRLLALAMGLAFVGMSPLVLLERMITPVDPTPPFLGVSPALGDRILYALSTLLLVPAAAAEELFFRGWLLRQTAAFLRRPLILVVGPALIFSTLHFDFNPDAFLARTLMGAGFAYMTLRLGGIEFSSGVHAMHNMMIVLFLQPLTFEPAAEGDLTLSALVWDLGLLAGYVAMTEAVARTPLLRWLGGIAPAELSRVDRISEHFS